jgi:signal transduction histidine kinase/ActR/RegA family two-component response regulator
MLRVFADSNWPSTLVTSAGAAFAILLAIAIALAFGYQAEPSGGDFVNLQQARFSRGLYDGRFGDRSQRAVNLPHAWALTDPGATGDAWYTLTWPLDTLPTMPQALCITALTVPTEVYVNGELVGASGPLDGRLPRSYEHSRYIDVPAGLLRVGANYIGVHVRTPVPDVAGLGPVLAGDATPLRERARKVLFVHTIAPAAISIATLTVGVFIFVLWLRRHDRAYLLFAVAVMLWSAHTLATLSPEPLLPPPHWAIAWTGTYLLFVTLLCLFCLRFANVRWRAYEWFVIAYAIAAMPMLYLAHALGVLDDVDSLARLGAILLVIAALGAVARYAIRRWNVESALLLVAGTISTTFAIHDWLAAQDALALRPVWLVPYAALAFLTLFGYLLTDRFVNALNESERMNVELERRVEEKSAALSAQLQATRTAKDAAEAANRAKSTFLAAASHDLRQPLHALGMFSQALAELTHEPDEQVLVQRITTSVSALEALFSALLDVSKLDAGIVIAHPRDFPIRPLLDRLADECMPDALERGLSLAVVCGDAVVRSDPVLLERIVRNLLANALRYTSEGGVVLGCRRRGRGYSLEVWDSGEGISPRDIQRIFEEFYQVGNPSRDRSRGLGLGLAIVHRLAELLGHEVVVASREGRGSMFRVVVAAGNPDTATIPFIPDICHDLLAGRHILVIDDEVDVRDATARLLTQWGCHVVAANGGDCAARAYAASSPDAMIVDFRLGDGADGLETIASLRARFGRMIPAVLVSGASAVEELALIEASGIPLLHKPLPPARLRSTLAHLLRVANTAELMDTNASALQV